MSMDEADLRVERLGLDGTRRRTVCVRGHMLMVDATGRVTAEVDRGMWVSVERVDWLVCPRCGGEIERRSVEDRRK